MKESGSMSTIYDFCEISSNCRPVYTKYELSKEVNDKLKIDRIDVAQAACKYKTDISTIKEIKDGVCSFSPKHYKVCAEILGISIEKIVEEYHDDQSLVNYRTETDQNDSLEIFEKANLLFNEIIMQEKIGIR